MTLLDVGDPGRHDALAEVLIQCFQFPGDAAARQKGWEEYRDLVGRENFRCMERGGTVAAGLAILPMGQIWGGHEVPMAGIAAVGVAPEHRGSGVAADLMAATLRELRETGLPLATLYASTQRLYRSVGFEQAGSNFLWETSLRELGRPDRHVPACPVGPEDPRVRVVQRAFAAGQPGALARSEALWKRIWERGDDVRGYLLGPPDAPEGYVIFEQRRGPGAFQLQVCDQAWLTARALARLWTLLSDHRSMVPTVTWMGPANEPMLAPLPEMRATLLKAERWMLRVVDVAAALTSRGWGCDGTVDLCVVDDVLPGNDGEWRLTVEGGAARCERGGHGDLRLPVRALAPLYAGLFSASTLHGLGWLEGPDAAIAAADRLFAGPEPWMTDRF